MTDDRDESGKDRQGRRLYRRPRPERRIDPLKALKGYGIDEGAWSNDEEMFDLIHQMRSRIIICSPCFGGKVIGAILFERTMDGTVNGKPTPKALIGARRRTLPQDRQGPRRTRRTASS